MFRKLLLAAAVCVTFASQAEAVVISCDPNATGSSAYPNVSCTSNGYVNVNATVTPSGTTTVQGTDANAAATTAKPVLVGGSTGTNTYNFKVDTSGQLYTNATIVAALPTGSNVIGNVGINGALPTGANTIGNVGITGALPAGANTIGGVNIISGTVNSSPAQVALVDGSGTVTTGGTSQQIFAANSTRNYLFIQNVSTSDEWINFGVAAVVGQPSIKLIAGASFSMEASTISNQTVNIIGATTGQAFTAKQH